MNKSIPYTLAAAVALFSLNTAQADSPELTMRDFSSGQIKKGVRSIGFGGDGATWGNYGLVWKDAGGVLTDYGNTRYTNGNDFHFAAAGATTPLMWHDLAIYIIDMSQSTNTISYNAKTPGFGASTVPATGSGLDHALFTKIAMPITPQISAGILLSYETSAFNAQEVGNPSQQVHYQTEWRPSGGFGVAWQPNPKVLAGFRVLFNNDLEKRTDSTGLSEGLARSQEYRLGVSVSPWKWALIDVGGTRLEKENELAGTHTVAYHPNLGFEQSLLDKKFTLRCGLDETSPTAGFSVKMAPFNLDFAYVRNMAEDRAGEIFGAQSNSFIATLSLDYEAWMK